MQSLFQIPEDWESDTMDWKQYIPLAAEYARKTAAMIDRFPGAWYTLRKWLDYARSKDMQINILEYPERSAERNPNLRAVSDDQTVYTCADVRNISRRVGTGLREMTSARDFVGILMEKCAEAVCCFMLRPCQAATGCS